MGGIMNKEWAWLTNERAHLLKWEDALCALSGKATTQNSIERAMLHQEWRRLREEMANIRVQREVMEEPECELSEYAQGLQEREEEATTAIQRAHLA
jgi:hypothetical protein